MRIIWYLLKCPNGNEAAYVKKCQESMISEGIQEVIYFQYQCMLRYGGSWHLENRALLPGYVFLAGTEMTRFRDNVRSSLIPCKISQINSLCSDKNLIGMSRGIIKNGIPVVTSGPLKGREYLIQKIDRHKRTAEIEVPITHLKTRILVGLEIYEKQA